MWYNGPKHRRISSQDFSRAMTISRFGEQSQSILVVDDDPGVAFMLETALNVEGFRVFTARNGQEALASIVRHGLPHLAIVNILMPVMDGLAFAKTVQEFADLPIVFLTSLEDENVIVKALDLYAEDYITKPFSPRELLARVKRLLRRVGDFAYASAPIIAVDGRLQVDFARQIAFVDGEAISLTLTESKLLYLLMRNAGQMVTNDFLLRRLYPLEETYEDALRVHVHRLRQKVEPASGAPRYIDQRCQIGRDAGKIVAVVRLVAESVPALIHGNHVVPGRSQLRRYQFPGPAVAGQAMD